MSLSPQEITYLELPRTMFRGYRPKDVDQLLERVADDLATTSRERDDLAERLKQLAAETAKQSELEALLRSTLISAERAAQDLKEQARRESDLIVQEAHAESRRVMREALAEQREIEDATRKIRAMLRVALDAVEGLPTEVEPSTPSTNSGSEANEPPASGIREVAG